MSDNVSIVGETIAADEVTIDGALAKVQRVKVVHGVAGSGVDASTSNPLPVALTGTPALPTGAASETTLASVLTSVDGVEALLAHLTDGTLLQKQVPLTGATVAQVASSATSVTLKAANASRRSLSIFNDSTAVLYVKFGATASTSSYTVKLNAGDYFEAPLPMYQGVIDGIWASANGSALVTEGS
jgi:hypothetical protein